MSSVGQQLSDGETLQVSVNSSWRSKRAVTREAGLQTARVHLQDQACQSNERHSKYTQTDRLFKKYSDAVRGDSGLRSVVTFLQRFDVEGWCLEAGKLCTWNLARPGFDACKPDIALEVDSCLQCCAYHPQQPGLIAGGTYTGDIYVWDLAQEGDFQVFKSAISASSHQEPITAVSWHSSSASDPLLGGTEESDLLVSLASDGRLLVWRWHTAELLHGFELMWQHPDMHKMVLWGGTCMALPQQGFQSQPGGCLVGSEGGAVFRCSIEATPTALQAFAQAVSAQQKALISSPIKSLVCKHAGAVHAISASPFDPRLVISCGLDGQVRLCSSLIRQPLLEVAPSASYLFSVQWSPTRPMLFAVGAGDGRALLYDLMQDSEHPMQVLDVCGAPAPVYDLAFNSKAPELFATTDQQSVKIWTLAEGLVKPIPNEKQAFQKLMTDKMRRL